MTTPRAVLRTWLIGLCMGSADAVPGVSGGTIALIAGVYERLIAAITALTPRNGVHLLRAFVPPDAAEIRDALEEIDAVFLLPLGVGILTAVVIVTRVVHYADQHHPVALFGFFFGLIAASVIVLLPQITLTRKRSGVAAVVGFLIAYLLSGEITVLSGGGVLITFVAGAIAVSAMILPGISGSLMLVILGQYTAMSETLSVFTSRLAALATGGGTDALLEPGRTVVVFVIGAIIGLLSVARVVRRALQRDREATMAFLVALVVGALRAPIAEIGGRPDVGWTTGTVSEFALAALVGGLLLYALDYYAIDVELYAEDQSAAE